MSYEQKIKGIRAVREGVLAHRRAQGISGWIMTTLFLCEYY